MGGSINNRPQNLHLEDHSVLKITCMMEIICRNIFVIRKAMTFALRKNNRNMNYSSFRTQSFIRNFSNDIFCRCYVVSVATVTGRLGKTSTLLYFHDRRCSSLTMALFWLETLTPTIQSNEVLCYRLSKFWKVFPAWSHYLLTIQESTI